MSETILEDRRCGRCGSSDNGFYANRYMCKECDKARSQEYRARNKGKVLEYARQYYRENKDQKRKWNRANRERNRARYRRWRYGMTQRQFDALFEAQEGKCAICGIDPRTVDSKWNTLCVDHCHATHVIRGLLCHGCNRAIGFIQERPEVARAIATYLERA